MHFQLFVRHHRFEDALTECPSMIRNIPVRGPRLTVFSPDVFPYLDLECNHHTQYLLAMVCVLVYIFLKSGLIFLGFALARWKWICKATFLMLKVDFIPNLLLFCSECSDVISGEVVKSLLELQLEEAVPFWQTSHTLNRSDLSSSNARFQSLINGCVEKLLFIFATIVTYVCAMIFQ